MSNRNAAAFFAWLLLLVAITGVVVAQQLRPHAHLDETGEKGNREGATQERSALDLQARLLVGAVETVGRDAVDPSVWIRDSKSDSAQQRVYYLALAGELGGSKEEKRLYDEFAPALAEDPDRTWAELASVVDRLYADYERKRYDHPWLSEKTRERLVQQLGWSGKLALAPEGGANPEEREHLLESASRTFVILGSVFLAVVVLFIMGLFGWFFLPVLCAFGKSRFGIPPDVPHHGVYVETFTLWVILYGLLSAVLVLIAPEGIRLLMSAVSMLLSLGVLAWPVIRGIPWRQVREDIGLTWGRRPFLEPFVGMFVYSMTLYLVVFGALIAYAIILLERGGPIGSPGQGGSPQDFRPNPIVEYMTHMDVWTWLQVFFAASVVAPIVEETMFRGVLYRHLRGTGRWLGTVLSVLVSALLVSFIFAIIHPQTLYAVPVLMALAFGFTLAREWRGSLVAPMVAHGLHNGLIILVVSQVFAN
jgi:membrane protease YdiL (CAAX protease family)